MHAFFCPEQIVHESYYFPPNIFIPMSSTLRYAKPYLYRQAFAHTNSFLYSFVSHTLSDWNALSSYVTNTISLLVPKKFQKCFYIHTFISLTLILPYLSFCLVICNCGTFYYLCYFVYLAFVHNIS